MSSISAELTLHCVADQNLARGAYNMPHLRTEIAATLLQLDQRHAECQDAWVKKEYMSRPESMSLMSHFVAPTKTESITRSRRNLALSIPRLDEKLAECGIQCSVPVTTLPIKFPPQLLGQDVETSVTK